MNAHKVGTCVPCLYCEYDLRGLANILACPECGTPVDASVDLAVPGPVSSITWIRRGLLMTVIQLCTVFIYGGIHIGFGGSGAARAHVALVLAIVVNCALCVLGSWWMTTPCDRSDPSGHWRMRLTVRILALASVASALLGGGFYVGKAASWIGFPVHLGSLMLNASWIASLGFYLGGSIIDVGLTVRIRRAAVLACSLSLVVPVVLFCDAFWPRTGAMPSWVIVGRGVVGVGGLLSVLWLARELLAIREWYLRIVTSIEELRRQSLDGQGVGEGAITGFSMGSRQ